MVTRTISVPNISSFFEDPFFVGFDRLIDRINTAPQREGQPSYPPYNVTKVDENNFKIEVALAGFTEDDIQVSVKENCLDIKVAHTSDSQKEDVTYLHRGIGLRGFARTWTLADTIEVRGATFKNGLLVVDLENVIPESQKPRTIVINGDVGSPEFLTEDS